MIETRYATAQVPDSVVQCVDTIIRKAINYRASDIHCEFTKDAFRIRYRIDGMLYDQQTVDLRIAPQLISRLKVLAHIDITEKRIPQDGKFGITIGDHTIDLRVATFPTIYGEKVVVRILDRASIMFSLDQLGFQDGMLCAFRSLLQRASGFFLVTGPTGSGKTTTLYAALSSVNVADKNIVTLEDPVEYYVHGITQAQIHPDVGFTFEKGMRALLRQDPNVIMVGEIRDRQTAHIAIEAALTGHLVLSTVHTTDAPSVIMRLMDMGIEPFLINAAITGVLAQRLVRTLCAACKQWREPTEQERALLARMHITMSSVAFAPGCDACLQLGYKGRIGIFELLTMNSSLRSLIGTQPSCDALYAQVALEGMQSLRDDGIEKIKQGIIGVAELARVLL